MQMAFNHCLQLDVKHLLTHILWDHCAEGGAKWAKAQAIATNLMQSARANSSCRT